MDAHALTIKTVRDGPVCTLMLCGDLDLLETGMPDGFQGLARSYARPAHQEVVVQRS